MKRYLSLVLLLCLSVIAFAQPPQTTPPAKKQLTIEAMFAPGGLMTTGPQGLQWSPDGTKVAYLQRGAGGEQISLYYIDPATGKTAVLVASEKFAAMKPPEQNKGDDRQRDNRQRYGVAAYHWAPDSKSLLFDSMGHLWLYNLAGGTSVQLTSSPEASGDPKFSPDGAYISYVRKHNLFIKPTSAAAEKQLTKDTDENLLNGEVDWVYSEELAVRSNYFWSPDNKQIVFLQMNETAVPTYPIVDWIPTHPTVDQMKYPKAGDPNPSVRLGVVDLNGKTKLITVTDETDVYVPRFGWAKPGILWVMVLNRLQNKQDLYLVDAASGKSKLVLTESDDKYIELSQDGLTFFKSGDRFLWSSWRDGHTHLYLYSLDKSNPLASEAKLVNQVTKGDWEVNDVKALDEAAGVVYFTGNKDDARQTQLYSIKLDGSGMTQLTKEKGSHSPSMADNAKYFVDSYSSLMTMPKMAVCSTGGACNEVWAAKGMDQYELQTPEFVDFKADDGTVLHGVILLPKTGPAVVNGKVPIILNPYGGPHGQSVRDGYGAMGAFDQLLAMQGIGVLKVDNRGMGNRGRAFATATYRHLYDLELKDQLAALDQAMEKYPQIDRNRLGWWGWSYGGSMTAYALTHSTMFKAGVAVAPVTDWRNYDSIYTERYMSLPKLNEEGYKAGDVSNSAKNLSGALLLVHGTSDDNVHMQNSMQFMNAMINAGKQYDFLAYPRKTHGISGFQARTHLYHRILGQFQDAFIPRATQ
jgi:dipeptidyl-peptidase 4